MPLHLGGGPGCLEYVFVWTTLCLKFVLHLEPAYGPESEVCFPEGILLEVASTGHQHEKNMLGEGCSILRPEFGGSPGKMNLFPTILEVVNCGFGRTAVFYFMLVPWCNFFC